MQNQPEIAQRKNQFLAQAAIAAASWYDEGGNWIALSTPAATRERFWLCFALYSNQRASLADAVIRAAPVARTPLEWSIFDPNIACALLVRHRDQMAPDVQAKLEALVRDAFGFKPGNRQPDFQFHGYNDNMPAKATLGLILGGEMLGHPEAVEYGLWNLRQLRAMLVRSGINSEFNSPTYTPLTLHALAEIGEHARSEEARTLAQDIEARLWLDLAARFHIPTGTLAGPYSRAYTVDTVGHLSDVAALLWFHLGDRATPSPMELFAPPADLVLHHMGDAPFNIAQFAWLAAANYHLPPTAWSLFNRKKYPHRTVATCELGPTGPDWPARPGRIETWQQPDYTVATASTSFCGGDQSTPYFATYRRAEPSASFRETGTVFSKLVVNDEVPGTLCTQDGRPLDDATPLPSGTLTGERDQLGSHACSFAMQAGSTALVLTHPHVSLGGSAGGLNSSAQVEARPLTRLRELVLFPTHGGGADEIIVAGTPRASWHGEAPRGSWVVCRRGRLLIGIRPLVYGCGLDTVPITLEDINNYHVLSATFYHGPERTFGREELRHFFGGFVAEHASVDEFASLQEFADMLAEAKFTDYFWATRRTRYHRPASRRRPALDMELAWSGGAAAPRYATIDGRPIESPITRIDGVDETVLPFLNEPFVSTPEFFPWSELATVWYDLPAAIGDKGV